MTEFVARGAITDGREGRISEQPQSGTMLREQSRCELGLREEETEVAVASGVLDIGKMMLSFDSQFRAHNRLNSRRNRRLIKRHRSVQIRISQSNRLCSRFDRERHNLFWR